jgi:hypothetical protein
LRNTTSILWVYPNVAHRQVPKNATFLAEYENFRFPLKVGERWEAVEELKAKGHSNREVAGILGVVGGSGVARVAVCVTPSSPDSIYKPPGSSQSNESDQSACETNRKGEKENFRYTLASHDSAV